MAFMLKKKRYKFQVDLCLEELSEVSYGKAVLFAKVRQLDGGSFVGVSKRMEVQNHRVKYSARFQFPCKMSASATSGILETCKCRISIRLEEKGGRHFRKLGFTDINLAEYAGAGPSTQRYIMQPYDQNHRLDNSIVTVSLSITLREGDTIFQRPLTRHQPILLPGEEPPQLHSPAQSRSDMLTVPTTEHVKSESGSSLDPSSHTRNSSTTSHTSQASAGYASSSTTQNDASASATVTATSTAAHSRHSSSGDSSTHGRNLSQGSSDTGFFGSMEKEKRRKQKLDDGRIDAERVINELMETVDLQVSQDDENPESSGLQLYVGKDGSVTFDKSAAPRDFEPVVFGGPR